MRRPLDDAKAPEWRRYADYLETQRGKGEAMPLIACQPIFPRSQPGATDYLQGWPPRRPSMVTWRFRGPHAYITDGAGKPILYVGKTVDVAEECIRWTHPS